MAMSIRTNVAALSSISQLSKTQSGLSNSLEKISSGLRINRAADDAAGLSVSEGMRSEILGMRQGVRNAEQGISMIQLAEGSLNEVSNMLRRMREISVQSANSTINDVNRQSLSAEFNQLYAEIDRIATSTTYNDNVLLTGFGNAVSQNSDVSTALDGYSGVREIGISGALPGTYEFSDEDTDDGQITLSVTLPDGTELKQSIDMGTSLDRDNDQNVVATGTTWVANFDRLGVQVTLIGPNVDFVDTFKSPIENGGAGGSVVIGNETIEITAAESVGVGNRGGYYDGAGALRDMIQNHLLCKKNLS